MKWELERSKTKWWRPMAFQSDPFYTFGSLNGDPIKASNVFGP